MTIDIKKFEEALEKDLQNPNGYWNTITKKRELKEKRFEKFENILKSNTINFDDLFDRLLKEHGEEYKNKCYSNGCEPYPNRKLSFLLSYIEHNLEPITTPDFIGDDFPTDTYFFKGKYWATTHGQGCFTHIYDINKNRILTI